MQHGLAEATFEQRRQLVLLLIDRVVVTDADVEIRYVLPTSSESEHVRFCQLRKDYFNHPAAREQDEALGGVGPLDDFDGPAAERGEGGGELLTGIAAIGEEVAQLAGRCRLRQTVVPGRGADPSPLRGQGRRDRRSE